MTRQPHTEKDELASLTAQIEARERELHQLKEQRFATLPAMLGVESIDELIFTLAEWATPKLRAKLSDADAVAAPRPSRATTSTRTKRGSKHGRRFDDEIKAALRAELEEGKKTIPQLAKEYGPSAVTIAKWKAVWGLTSRRRHKTHGRAPDPQEEKSSSNSIEIIST